MVQIWKYLEKIRQQPEPQKKMFAFVTAIILTIIIVISWLATPASPFSTKKPQTESAATSPMAAIGRQFSALKTMVTINRAPTTTKSIENMSENGNLMQ